MKNPIKMDDLGVPLFLETPIGFHCNFFFFPVVRCGESLDAPTSPLPKNGNTLDLGFQSQMKV